MEINRKKIYVMLEEHKGRGGEVGALFRATLKKVDQDAPGVKFLLKTMVEFYRHVGAVWALESILEGKDHDWSNTDRDGDTDASG